MRADAGRRPVPGRSASAVERWLARQAARERRAVYLEDALLTGRFGRYARYRLKFFFLRYLLESALYGIKFLLLASIFSTSHFVALVAITALAALLASFWWGALEVMRGRIRTLWRAGKPHLVPEVIADWLGRAAIGAGASLLAGTAWVAWVLGPGREPFGVLHLTVLVVCLRFSVDLLVLTFHSGVFAIRRIYRPLPAIVATELAGFVPVLAAWPWLGAWSLPIAMLSSAAASTAVAVGYTARLYRFFGFLPLPTPTLHARGLRGELLAAGSSYALMKLDAFLVLALFTASVSAAKPVELFLLFFSIGPTIQAGFDWAQLFYFDLKRLEVTGFHNLRRRYDAFLGRLAWVLGILFWVLGCGLATLIHRTDLGALYWLLGPFFLSRSVLAIAQMRAFAGRRYGALLVSGLLLLAALALLRVGIEDDRARLGLLAAWAFLVAVALGAGPRGRRAAEDDAAAGGRVLPLAEWLAEVRRVGSPLRIGSAQLCPTAGSRGPGRGPAAADVARWRQRRLAERIARRLRDRGAVTTIGAGRIGWYERADGRGVLSRGWILTLGGGLLDSVRGSPYLPDGVAVLEAARAEDLLGDVLRAGLRETRIPGRGDDCAGQARRLFTQTFAEGVLYAPDEPLPPLFDRLSSRDKRTILSDAAHFATALEPHGRRSRFEVTALCEAGELRLLFLVDRRADRQARARWNRRIRRLNLEAALGA